MDYAHLQHTVKPANMCPHLQWWEELFTDSIFVICMVHGDAGPDMDLL